MLGDGMESAEGRVESGEFRGGMKRQVSIHVNGGLVQDRPSRETVRLLEL